MVIAVNAGYSFKIQKEEYKNFVYQCFQNIAKAQPQHTFIFISDEPFPPSYSLSENSIPVVVSYKLMKGFFRKFSLKKKIAFALKKYKAAIYVTDEAMFIAGMNIPQYILINHFSFQDKLNKKHLQKANALLTDSEFLKRKISEEYAVEADKIFTVYPGIEDNFKSISLEQREIIKDKYAEGKEYFLCADSITSKDNLITLLKAFSVFKKRQKSSMQLLITGEAFEKNEAITESLRTYKYKEEVKVLDSTAGNEIIEIFGSAYAVVCPFYAEGNYLPVLQIMKSEVPVITHDTNAIKEVCGGTVLYADKNNFNDLADKMMLLFKDEEVRRQLIEKGKTTALKFTWKNAANMLWKGIIKDDK